MKEQKREQKKGNKYIAPILCGLAVVLVAAIYVFVILWTALVEPIPLPFLLFLFLIPAAILFGVVYATLERLKEIKGGEEDDSADY